MLQYIKKTTASVSNILAKLNQRIHGSIDAAEQTTKCIKSSDSGMATAKGIRDCVVS